LLPYHSGPNHLSNIDRWGRACNSSKVSDKGNPRGKHTRPPRIRVPNNERALFTVNDEKFVGVIKRLSLTGGSTVLPKGPLPQGTHAEMVLKTVFGRVSAQIEFIHTGADGMPLAQAFRFVRMDKVSSERFAAAAKQMERAGFSDAKVEDSLFASEGWSKLRANLRRLSGMPVTGQPSKSKSKSRS
jgi:hypothetical protein